MNILVSTTNYFSDSHTKNLLDTFRQHCPDKINIDFFIVDNSQTLNHDEVGCRVIVPGKNVGLAKSWKIACDKFAENKLYDFLFLCNNDVYIKDSSLFSELTKYRKNFDIAGPIIYGEDNTIWSAGGDFGFFLNVKHSNTLSSELSLQITGHISGCFLIISSNIKSNLHSLIDDSFFFRGEEWFLNYQAAQYNYQLRLMQKARVFHPENSSHERFSERHIYYAIRAKLHFYKKISISCWKSITFTIIYLIFLFSWKWSFYYKRSNLTKIKTLQIILLAVFDNIRQDEVIENTDLTD